MFADFSKRLLAYIIDGAILGAIGFLLSVPFFFAAVFGGNMFVWILEVVIGWLYFALMESSVKQATLGKLALGIVVTDVSGQRIGFGVATGRYFGKILSTIPLWAGFIMAAFTERKQGLHDVLAGTLVLNRGDVPVNMVSASPSNNYRSAGPVGNARPLLCGVTGSYAGQMIPVDEKGLIIGRDPLSCNIVINSDAISRMHSIVKYDPAQSCFTLTDTCSSNGTFLASGVRIGNGQAMILRSGDRFFLAGKENMFEVRV